MNFLKLPPFFLSCFFFFCPFEEINRVLMSPEESLDKSKMSTTEMSASLQDSDSITPFLCPSWRWASYISFTAKWLKHKCVCSVVFSSLWPHGLQPARLLGPWNFPSRILEGDTISYSRRSSWYRDWTHVSFVSFIGRQVLYLWATWESLVKLLVKPFHWLAYFLQRM